MSEEVIELSVEETNKLRAELGLAPLRVSGSHNEVQQNGDENQSGQGSSEEVLELSVDDTNALRAKLGLKPLRGGSGKEVVHKPAINDSDAQEAAARIEEAKLQRDVKRGVNKTFGSTTLADEADDSALSWAAKMRQQKTKEKKKKKKNLEDSKSEKYEENDLEGMQVSHRMSELEAGSTTVLTLADTSLLQVNDSKKAVGLNEAEDTLENVNLKDQKKQKDGLKKKRMLEMGMGRAGGYAGFDDDEFEELGGTLGPSRKERGNVLLEGDQDDQNLSNGFRIGLGSDDNSDKKISDFDAIQSGKAISLVSTTADVASSDYMTIEEMEAEKAKRKLLKDGKFKKKKKHKKDKKKRRRKVDSDDDEEESYIPTVKKTNILEQLEETAVPNISSGMRKRRLSESEEQESNGNEMEGPGVKQESINKRARYDEIMAKGNERTRLAFQEPQKTKIENDIDDEPDDSFLNAALAKARRLNRLREMNNQQKTRGADAVALALKESTKSNPVPDTASSSSGTLTFSVDDTREFTRAIQARASQQERESRKSKPISAAVKIEIPSVKSEPKVEDVPMEEEASDQEIDINELAKEVKTDDIPASGLDGASSEKSGVGRGLSSFVSMLKHTGEISGKRSGKEELRGRAKDERNYDNYEALDLSKVVKIGRDATEKDKEFAAREIKLEYRDKHGRLLTQKEAFRDLCYQFHGHGAGKKREEKNLRQIAREQAEARLTSRQVSAARDGTTAGTLGALKATQKATGKAFIVHKT